MATPLPSVPAPTPNHNKKRVIIPTWHPPYENPLQLQSPVHFDGSAKRERVRTYKAKYQQHPDYDCWEELKEDFKATHGKKGVTLGYITAITGAARMLQIQPAPSTPPFFALTLWGDTIVDYESLHPNVTEMVKKYFSHLEVVIVRYFHEADDVDF